MFHSFQLSVVGYQWRLIFYNQLPSIFSWLRVSYLLWLHAFSDILFLMGSALYGIFGGVSELSWQLIVSWTGWRTRFSYIGALAWSKSIVRCSFLDFLGRLFISCGTRTLIGAIKFRDKFLAHGEAWFISSSWRIIRWVRSSSWCIQILYTVESLSHEYTAFA